jgi:hypothetical protein
MLSLVNSESVAFSAVVAPLISKFGERLTLWRDGNRVQWSCDGQTAVVDLQADGTLDATFLDRISIDEVTGAHVLPVYRRKSGIAYRLTLDGSERMIADMTAFFSGEREARFAFAGAEWVEPTL